MMALLFPYSGGNFSMVLELMVEIGGKLMGPGEDNAPHENIPGASIRNILARIEVAHAKAAKLEHKFLAYLLEMAQIEAQRLARAGENKNQ